jgi:hypothetical protein
MRKAVWIPRDLPEYFKEIFLPLIAAKTFFRSDPQIFVRILMKYYGISRSKRTCKTRTIRQRLPAFGSVEMKAFNEGIEPVQSLTPVSDPQLVVSVKVEIADPAVRRRAVVFPLKVAFETIPIIPVQTVLGSEPNESLLVFYNTGHQAVGQAFFHTDM